MPGKTTANNIKVFESHKTRTTTLLANVTPWILHPITRRRLRLVSRRAALDIGREGK
jgi:hypothetical protein